MENKNEYTINWNNINLKSPYQSNLNILDDYNFDTLLLEISCNVKNINEATVKAQAMESIKAKYNEAIEISNANLKNITNEALQYRNAE